LAIVGLLSSPAFLLLIIGPYVCAEWNFGGFPVWLKYLLSNLHPGVTAFTRVSPTPGQPKKKKKKISAFSSLLKPFVGPLYVGPLFKPCGTVQKPRLMFTI
jgi:hypothetical protein